MLSQENSRLYCHFQTCPVEEAASTKHWLKPAQLRGWLSEAVRVVKYKPQTSNEIYHGAFFAS